ncbi:MAG TPA: HNH endonuclease, partial [Candidatus Eisenbacteria bacterium]|nr:HNH endonuclease [Candidatus Eisenbacteria bacterium]
EDAAAKRIHAARAARAFPQFLDALAQGRIHLSGLCVLAAHLRPHNADQLLAAATHKTRSEIEQLVAERFPRTEAMALIIPVAAPSLATCQHAPGHVGPEPSEHAPGHVDPAPSEHAPGHVPAPTPARVTPIAAQRFVIQVTVSQQTHGKLEHLRALLSHAIPGGELADVLDYALSMTITQVEKRKFGATDRPRAPRHCANPRHIPAHVRRAVHARDGGRCTFVADDGYRCEARRHLEFDHVEPLARGGASTIDNLRLRCRAHNQLAAEQTFGAGFMDAKREAARLAARGGAGQRRATAGQRRTRAAAGRDRGAAEPGLSRGAGAAAGGALERARAHARTARACGPAAPVRDARFGPRTSSGRGVMKPISGSATPATARITAAVRNRSSCASRRRDRIGAAACRWRRRARGRTSPDGEAFR